MKATMLIPVGVLAAGGAAAAIGVSMTSNAEDTPLGPIIVQTPPPSLAPVAPPRGPAPSAATLAPPPDPAGVPAPPPAIIHNGGDDWDDDDDDDGGWDD